MAEKIPCGECRLGVGLHKVTFADHRSGYGGLILRTYFFYWMWSWCVVKWPIRWRTPFMVKSIREQLQATHGEQDQADEQQRGTEFHRLLRHVGDRLREENNDSRPDG